MKVPIFMTMWKSFGFSVLTVCLSIVAIWATVIVGEYNDIAVIGTFALFAYCVYSAGMDIKLFIELYGRVRDALAIIDVLESRHGKFETASEISDRIANGIYIDDIDRESPWPESVRERKVTGW
jgi:ABC-type transport system involved in cytochrome c biogenesis permease subunit